MAQVYPLFSLKTLPVQFVPVDSTTCWAPQGMQLPLSVLPLSPGSLSLLCQVGLEALSLGLPAVRKHCHPFSHPQRRLSDKERDLILELAA